MRINYVFRGAGGQSGGALSGRRFQYFTPLHAKLFLFLRALPSKQPKKGTLQQRYNCITPIIKRIQVRLIITLSEKFLLGIKFIALEKRTEMKNIALYDMCGRGNFTKKQNFPFNVGDKHESVVQKGVLG